MMFNRAFSLVILSSLLLTGCGESGSNRSGFLSSSRIKPGTQEDLVHNVGDRVFFNLNSSEVREEDQLTLQKQALWLAKNPQTNIQIEGHCDVRGTREYNLGLGDRRAAKVKDYLVTLGVAPSRIETISFGKERPAVLGEFDDAHSQNRRGVCTIKKN